MKEKFFIQIGCRSGLLIAGVISLVSLAGADAQQIPALEGINRVSDRHGGKFIQKIVEMKGEDGQAQPEEWELIVYDPSSGYLLREFWIGDRRATNEGINYDYYPKKQPTGFINVRRLKLGSVKAFEILDREAGRAKIGFDSIDYHLRCREFSDEPIWTLTAKDEDGYEVGRIDLSGETGRVMRTVWTYREGRKMPLVKDSAVLARPSSEPEPIPLERSVDLEAERRRLASERDITRPANGDEPGEVEPLDPEPEPVEDPGTEIPEVEPIDIEELPGADEP